MDELTKIQQQAEELSDLLTEAIDSGTRETQEQALYSYEYFQLINKKIGSGSLMKERSSVSNKIKLAQLTIMDLIATIEDKAKTLREILGIS